MPTVFGHTHKDDLNEPVGLGGWLILVGLGVVVSPFLSGYTFITEIGPIFNEPTWSRLTEPGSIDYDPAWAPILITEAVVNTGQILVMFWMIPLFFNKRAIFPKVFVYLSIFSIAFFFVSLIAIAFVIDQIGPADIVDVRTVLEQIFAVIWILYMLKSVRVRNTFVN